MKRVKYVWFASSLLAILFLTACSTSAPLSGVAATGARPVATATSAAQTPGGTGCHPASPVLLPQNGTPPVGSLDMPQVQGKVSGGELWALIFNGWPMQARQRNKIAWRMTGSGNLQLVARGPGGQIVRPTDFIPHDGSNWQRPGEEWGSEFIFPVPGCWNIHATRGNLSGDIWFMVA